MPDRIDRMFASIAEDASGEGLTRFLSVSGLWMPMVAADEKRVDSLREIAQSVANAFGKPVRLCVFERRVELEERSSRRRSGARDARRSACIPRTSATGTAARAMAGPEWRPGDRP